MVQFGTIPYFCTDVCILSSINNFIHPDLVRFRQDKRHKQSPFFPFFVSTHFQLPKFRQKHLSVYQVLPTENEKLTIKL
jgi:hypothetical protein